MDHLDSIAEEIRASFDALTAARDNALTQARALTRHCAHAIRAVHREDHEKADQELGEAQNLAKSLREDLVDYPNLYFSGYSQDALKEFAEAKIVHALVNNQTLPSPAALGLENNTYLKGLAEVVGELRRRILDILRHGHSDEVERLLQHMEDIYAILVTMDYPDAVTHGLRRLTDIARSIIERTRGDITLSLRQEKLEQTLREVEQRIIGNGE